MFTAIRYPKGEHPTSRDGRPDNYHFVAFENKKKFEAAVAESTAALKPHRFHSPDYVVFSDNRIVSTSDYLDNNIAFSDLCEPLPTPVYRVKEYSLRLDWSEEQLQAARREVTWVHNH